MRSAKLVAHADTGARGGFHVSITVHRISRFAKTQKMSNRGVYATSIVSVATTSTVPIGTTPMEEPASRGEIGGRTAPKVGCARPASIVEIGGARNGRSWQKSSCILVPVFLASCKRSIGISPMENAISFLLLLRLGESRPFLAMKRICRACVLKTGFHNNSNTFFCLIREKPIRPKATDFWTVRPICSCSSLS